MFIRNQSYYVIILMMIGICFSPSVKSSTQNTLDVFNDGKYIFKWTISQEDLTIKADLDVETIGWVGIGI